MSAIAAQKKAAIRMARDADAVGTRLESLQSTHKGLKSAMQGQPSSKELLAHVSKLEAGAVSMAAQAEGVRVRAMVMAALEQDAARTEESINAHFAERDEVLEKLESHMANMHAAAGHDDDDDY